MFLLILNLLLLIFLIVIVVGLYNYWMNGFGYFYCKILMYVELYVCGIMLDVMLYVKVENFIYFIFDLGYILFFVVLLVIIFII